MSGLALLIFLADARLNVWLIRGIMMLVAGIAVALAWASLATLLKRLHDRNYNGWFVLLAAVPLVNLWVYFEALFCAAGMRETGSDLANLRSFQAERL